MAMNLLHTRTSVLMNFLIFIFTFHLTLLIAALKEVRKNELYTLLVLKIANKENDLFKRILDVETFKFRNIIILSSSHVISNSKSAVMFFDFILSILQAIMELFSFGKNKISSSLSIYIKSNTGNTLALDLDPKTDIKNLKKLVADQLGLEPNDVKIIFAGKELLDSTVIEECDLGEKSVLHAVKVTKRRKNIAPTKPLCETLEEFQLAENSSQSISEDDSHTETPKLDNVKAHFYVYCSSPCKSINTGKIRVRCCECKYGAFTVDRDPQSWLDVLEPKRVTGQCNKMGCDSIYAEFYFKCSVHSSQGETDQAVPLNLIRRNVKEIPCLACTDVSDPVLVFPCDVGHVTCFDCFRTYCLSRLNDRQFFSHPDYGYTLSCPAGCKDSFIQEVHHFHVLNEEQYQRYQKFAAEEFILQSGGVLCPQPGCGAGILLEDKDCNRVQCLQGCNYVFCAKCLQGYHLGECTEGINTSNMAAAACDYVVDPEKLKRAIWDEASNRTIKVVTKPCPKCRAHTEKDGGCMHMICTRPNCGYHWCWVCQGPWGNDCIADHWFD